jgi:hypothetical protein
VHKINTAWHDRHLAGRNSQKAQLSNFVYAGGHDVIRRTCHRRLNADPIQWTGVRRALVAPLDRAKRMKGDEQRET